MKIKNILIIGELFSSNLGDGVICNCVKYIIEKNIKDVNIHMMDMYGRKGYIEDNNIKEKKTNNIKILLKKLLKPIINTPTYRYNRIKKMYKNKENIILKDINNSYDIAVFAGGQMFMDFFCFPINGIQEELSKYNIPIIFNACGYGKVDGKNFQLLLKKILNDKSVKSISCRDGIEIINREYLLNTKAYSTYDPALWSKEAYNIEKNETDTIGLGVMDVSQCSEKVIVEFWENIIKKLDKKNIKWQLFCNGNINDYILCKKIIKKINKPNKIEEYVCKRPINDYQLVKMISKYKSIISYRLHSHIVATSLEIPSVAIEWDSKVREFFKKMGYEERCFNIGDDTEDIVSEIIQIEGNPINLKDKKLELEELLINQIKGTIEI